MNYDFMIFFYEKRIIINFQGRRGGVRKCTLCDIRVSNMDEAEKHFRSFHNSGIPFGFWRKNNNEPVKCPECNDTFSARLYLHHHYTKVHPDKGRNI